MFDALHTLEFVVSGLWYLLPSLVGQLLFFGLIVGIFYYCERKNDDKEPGKNNS